jgi:DNA polymerase III epsilon subunit-like protein
MFTLITSLFSSLKLLGNADDDPSVTDSLYPHLKTNDYNASSSSPQRIFGLDCEMVGVGKKGEVSMLARVTIVEYAPPSSSGLSNSPAIDRFDPAHFAVLYDRIVTPTLKVKDYRTRYSGITKEILTTGLPSAPLVTFTQCRLEVAELIAGNVVSGHALNNDFSALKLMHPSVLKRDTANFGPFTVPAGKGKKVRQRKLRDIFDEEFGVKIQVSSSGHSSAEDASAALALYLKHRVPWEESIVGSENATPWTGKVDAQNLMFLLDGSNLPLGFKRDAATGAFTVMQKRAVDERNNRGGGHHNNNIHLRFEVIDWVPVLLGLVSDKSKLISEVQVYHDGAGLQHLDDFDDIRKGTKAEDNKTVVIELGNRVVMKITDVKEEADDVIVNQVSAGGCSVNLDGGDDDDQNVVSIESMICDLESDDVKSYFVVRRMRGGSKAEKKLFTRMNLRRPSEGAYCFCSLSPGLQKGSLSLAKRLKANRVDPLIRISKRDAGSLKYVVATDDVLLSDRIADRGGLVLTSRQLEEIIS